MQLDISDIEKATEEVIRLLKDYQLNAEYHESSYLILHNGRLDFRTTLKELWERELQDLLKKDSIRLYHVCRQDQEKRILTYGIYHDQKPTLTPSLVGAVAQAENYHINGRRNSSILRADVPASLLEFRYIDHMGPGFLPLATRTRDQISPEALPYSLIQDIFEFQKLPVARWLDPKYFESSIHRTSNETVKHILNSLIDH